MFAARPPILKYNQSHTPAGLILQTEESHCCSLRCISRAYKLLLHQRPLRSAQWPHRSLVSTVQCQRRSEAASGRLESWAARFVQASYSGGHVLRRPFARIAWSVTTAGTQTGKLCVACRICLQLCPGCGSARPTLQHGCTGWPCNATRR